MSFNFSKVFGPLTVHQYTKRLVLAGMFTLPSAYIYANISNKDLDVVPMLDTRLSPVHIEGYQNLWNEQLKVLEPYWTEDGEKRKALSEDQRFELDFLKSLRWSLEEKSSSQQQQQPQNGLIESKVKLDTTSSFFSVSH